MRFHQIIAVVWLALICAITSAQAEKRVALVVGNERYANLPAAEQLQKAVNDARAVGRALEQIGFEVIQGENLGRSALLGKLDELMQRLVPGDTAFFFFSGHGVALDGVNYILPADVPYVAAGQETRLKREALDEPYIISELTGRGVRVAVVVLDACRSNPFSRPGSKGVGVVKGLAPPPQVQGVFSFYAAGNGQTALDRLSDGDPNPNSVFSRVLAPALVRPGVDLATLAIEVREEVARIARTAGYIQRPAYYDETIGGRLYLAGLPSVNPGGGGGMSSIAPSQAADEVAWSMLKDLGNAEQFRRFIAQYPASPHRPEAEQRLKALEQTNVAIALPVRPAGRNNMTFFVTSAGIGKGGDLGGIEGADSHCQKLAEAAGAGGKTWHAYLSSSTLPFGGPTINARDRIGKGPWQNAKGAVIGNDVNDLHNNPGLTKETLLDEKGERIKGLGDTPNMHDILTGSDPQGRAFPGNMNFTCNNWKSSEFGKAMLGHGDREGVPYSVYGRSPFSSHQSRGCSQADLVATGGNGLFYCFAVQ